NLSIGTSGWSYPAGRGTWNGIFYPRPRPKGFDELAFYAEHFDTVEVNSTFYGQPHADVSRGWAARTPHDFEFSLKLYQKFTHPRMYEERVAKSLPEGARAGTAALHELTRPTAADLDEFRRGIDPIASAGKRGRDDPAYDRCDYFYSDDALMEFSEPAGAARRLVNKAYLYPNNHFSAKSVANATMIKQQLGEPIDGEYPPEFVERFPNLSGVVRTAGGRRALI